MASGRCLLPIRGSGGDQQDQEVDDDRRTDAAQEEEPEAVVFHSGTERLGSGWATQGGRILSVTGWGSDLRTALDRAYAAGKKIRFDGMHYRRDIGHRALARG